MFEQEVEDTRVLFLGKPHIVSCLENPRDGEAWWAAAHGVAESDMTEAT